MARGVYILAGVADFAPPALWGEVSGWSDAQAAAALEQGRLAPLYGPSLLLQGFEVLVRRAEAAAVDLAAVGSIELGLSYPRELCGLTEDQVVEGFRRHLRDSAAGRRLDPGVPIRFRPTSSASSSGMVPFNDAVAGILDEGHGLVLVVTAGNVKGTRPDRVRLSAAQSASVLANLISPLDRRLTGVQMLSQAALLWARACQHDPDLGAAIHKHVREVRLAVHRRVARGRNGVHISAHPDHYPDRVVFEPMRLMGVAPQSMGYAGLVLGREPGAAPRAVRVLGAGAGVDASSLRHRADPLASQAMMTAMAAAAGQAGIDDFGRLWLFEAHNAFPGVLLAELRRVLEWRGETAGVAEALLADSGGCAGATVVGQPGRGHFGGASHHADDGSPSG